LRYLAQGRVGFVFKEGREVRRLETIAPHWVRPFNFLFPVYDGDPYGMGVIRFGTWLYDWLGRLDSLLTRRKFARKHQVVNPQHLLARVPGLRGAGLRGAVEYFVDAQLQDSRFTLGLAQLASRFGARILTHTEVIKVSDFGENT